MPRFSRKETNCADHDGYNQVALLEGKGPSARHELFYFGGAQLGAVRVDNFKYQLYQQPQGWPVAPKDNIASPITARD